jgi:hypothetical protein
MGDGVSAMLFLLEVFERSSLENTPPDPLRNRKRWPAGSLPPGTRAQVQLLRVSSGADISSLMVTLSFFHGVPVWLRRRS